VNKNYVVNTVDAIEWINVKVRVEQYASKSLVYWALTPLEEAERKF